MVLQAELNIQNAMKSVSEALRLDVENKTKEAFVSYLQSTQYIVHTLMADVHGTDIMVCCDSLKSVKLGQQCLDRISAILNSLPQQADAGFVSQVQSDRMVAPPVAAVATMAPTSRKLGPVEMAEKRNVQLMAAYRARISQSVGGRHEQANMSLTLQRKMAENVALAKIREKAHKIKPVIHGIKPDELLKRLEDRQRRIDEEAVRRVAGMQDALDDKESSRQFYAQVLSFEQSAEDWEEKWREAVSERPDDTPLKASLIRAVLAAVNHPVTLVMVAAQTDVAGRLQTLSQHRDVDGVRAGLRGVVGCARDGLARLRGRLLLAYPPLDDAAGEDLANDALDAPFFTPFWRHLIAAFRCVNAVDEAPIAAVMADPKPLSLADIGVRPQFIWQPPGGHDAYAPAITELRIIVSLSSPMRKLDCIVQVSQLVCKLVQQQYSSLGDENVPIVGADDLIPILSYVILRSNLPQLLSEVRALEEFIHDGYLIGEEGYCLASFHTALAYLATCKRSPDDAPDGSSDCT